MPAAWLVPARALSSLPAALGAAQSVFAQTGGLHGAGLFALDGTLERSAEDVGRHNTVDKIVGAMLMQRRLPLSDHLLLPDFSSYRHTRLASPWPHNGVIADLAHEQGALVGYVHPFDFEIDPAKEKSLTYQLPADVAHGKVDYLEVVGFSDHRITAAVW